MWKSKILSFALLGLFLVASFAEEEVFYEPKNKRDPFVALVSPDGRLLKLDIEEENKQVKLNLEGIIYSKTGLSYAIVNGEVVRVGDNILGYDVLKIEEDKVIFIKEGQAQEVILKKEE